MVVFTTTTINYNTQLRRTETMRTTTSRTYIAPGASMPVLALEYSNNQPSGRIIIIIILHSSGLAGRATTTASRPAAV